MTIKVAYDKPHTFYNCGCGVSWSDWLFHSWRGYGEVCSGIRFLGIVVRYWGG